MFQQPENIKKKKISGNFSELMDIKYSRPKMDSISWSLRLKAQCCTDWVIRALWRSGCKIICSADGSRTWLVTAVGKVHGLGELLASIITNVSTELHDPVPTYNRRNNVRSRPRRISDPTSRATPPTHLRHEIQKLKVHVRIINFFFKGM